ncbi:hypothetical protein LTR84_008357 [Exophiala bonariae]|uniref:glycogenin glucosyltransferase n=1 Tax=Exophiala bonariae TaxID=1690606 RepID=A0AAV9MY53_9EURO|nr:hypothetical protein LTR84_008357 [Exophiala bonariae]
MAPIGASVFATLLMNDAYLPGAMVLGHSLKDRGAKAPLVAFIVVDKLSADTIKELRTVYDDVIPIQQIINNQPANLYLMGRPDLVSTFTKIELWRQTQFKRIVYLDADMVALRAPNELLNLDTEFAAVPDIGWPDCFNSGLLVLNPNMGDYYSLYALAQRGISFDGADQGLLNMHFREWERLSFIYNCTPSGNYQYVPAYRHFQSSIAVVHFIGKDKPWTLGRENKYNTGVYGELLGRWWSVYDKHYRSKEVSYYNPQTYESRTKVQDFVRGEEPLYVSSLPSQPAPPDQRVPSPPQQGQIPLPPEIVITDPSQGHLQPAQTVELPLGDAPTPVVRQDFTPVPTVQQRRFSAPHVDWEPARAPPPTDSKPEAANFPTTIYDFNSNTDLFQPPASYPEAPKDMWYEVPKQEPQPQKLKQIFPWESRAPKPTRVFPQSKAPSPPPTIEPEPEPQAPTATEEEVDTTGPPSTTTASDITEASTPTPIAPPIDPWAAFESRTNAWDDMPEIERYVQAFSQARKGKLQVLHHTPSPRNAPGVPSVDNEQRRPSMKLTDFPTEIERPSLPVTPAPIRRPSFWGEERDQLGNLPPAQGVPKQEDWVRRFSSYSQPVFPDLPPPLHNLLHGIFYWRCQYCGKQNPVSKLEELQRRQSEVLISPTETLKLEDGQELPQRKMPESQSKEAVIQAADLATSPTKSPKVPKPILKEPRFELGKEEGEPDYPEISPDDLKQESVKGAPEVAAVGS